MDKLDKQITFVKDLIVAQETMAEKYKDQSYRADKHRSSAYKLKELLEFLNELKKSGLESLEPSNRVHSAKRLNLSLEDIEDLPPELISELNINDTDRQELIIEDIIKKAGGVLSLDKVIVELYRRTGEIIKRNTMTSRLYRMVQRKMIFNVPSRKGVYSSYELSDSEVRRLFGDSEPDYSESN